MIARKRICRGLDISVEDLFIDKTINRVHCTLNMDCSHRATGRHLRVMYET